MTEPPLSDDELRVLRRIIHYDEGRNWFRKMLRERLKAWGMWIAIVMAIVGGLRSFLTDYWVGRH